MTIAPFKILRDAQIDGKAIVRTDIDVAGNANITGDANITSNAIIAGDATITGDIINNEFFPLHPHVVGVQIEVDAGIIVPTSVTGDITRYYINRSNVTQTIITTTDFTDTVIWGEWFSGSGQTPAADSLTQIDFVAIDWVTETDGTLTIPLTHNLKTETINVRWYQDGEDGSVFVPWKSSSEDAIVGCIPQDSVDPRKFAFKGFIRIVASQALPSNFDSSFTASTWQQVGTTDSYIITFVHSLENSDAVD